MQIMQIDEYDVLTHLSYSLELFGISQKIVQLIETIYKTSKYI